MGPFAAQHIASGTETRRPAFRWWTKFLLPSWFLGMVIAVMAIAYSRSGELFERPDAGYVVPACAAFGGAIALLSGRFGWAMIVRSSAGDRPWDGLALLIALWLIGLAMLWFAFGTTDNARHPASLTIGLVALGWLAVKDRLQNRR